MNQISTTTAIRRAPRRTRTTPATVRADKVWIKGNPQKYQERSLKIIGAAIRNASKDIRIRNHAARLAARARPKDYLGQVKNIYRDFLSRWRYVKDPIGAELMHTSPDAIYRYVMGMEGGLGDGIGAEDCEGATIALGALMQSIGIPVRLALIAGPNAPRGPMFQHIFPQASIPGYGWMSVDPVPYPQHGLGYTPPHSRIAFADLHGRIMRHFQRR